MIFVILPTVADKNKKSFPERTITKPAGLLHSITPFLRIWFQLDVAEISACIDAVQMNNIVI